MLKYMNMNMIYKTLRVLLGENPEVSHSPSTITSAQWPWQTARRHGCGHVCTWPPSFGSWSTPEEQILDSFWNVPFCHPWTSAHKSSFISISSFSKISGECGPIIWALNHPLPRMGKIIALFVVKFLSMLSCILLTFIIKGEWYCCDHIRFSEMKGPWHAGR